MSLKLEPLQLADLDQLVHHADKGSPGDDCIGPPNPLAWPVTTRSEAQVRARCAMALQRRRLLRDPTVRFLKVVDGDLPQDDNIIAVARWHYYPQGYDPATEAHWEMAPETLDPILPYMSGSSSPPPPPLPKDEFTYPPPNFNLALYNAILADRDAFRPSWMDREEGEGEGEGKGEPGKPKPCWMLMHLTTRPSHRNRGAAALLIRWGTARAAQDKVPAYLEAGAQARPIYTKYGFEQVGGIRPLDMKEHGLHVTFELTSMVFRP